MFFRKQEKEKIFSLYEAEGKYNFKGALPYEKISSLRKIVPILAIDDYNFPPERNLKNSGFNITVDSDIRKINEVEDYIIILCDINGIGTDLSTETQGAYVIEEIKKNYPEKIVIAFTADREMSELSVSAKINADGYLKKDAPIEEWRDLLDEKIKEICNPIAIWKKERIRLLEAGIELQELLKLEQIILANLTKGASEVKSEISKTTQNTKTLSWSKEVGKFLLSKTFDIAFDFFKDSYVE